MEECFIDLKYGRGHYAIAVDEMVYVSGDFDKGGDALIKGSILSYTEEPRAGFFRVHCLPFVGGNIEADEVGEVAEEEWAKAVARK